MWILIPGCSTSFTTNTEGIANGFIDPYVQLALNYLGGSYYFIVSLLTSRLHSNVIFFNSIVKFKILMKDVNNFQERLYKRRVYGLHVT